MTDQIAALSALVDVSGAARDTALAEFYEQWKHEPLVMLKWLGIQVNQKSLLHDPSFQEHVPPPCT